MKSPLVDALRKARERGSGSEETDPLLVGGLPHDATLTANEDYREDALELADDKPPNSASAPDREDAHEETAAEQIPRSHALTATQALRQTSLAVEAPPLPLSDRRTLTTVMRVSRYLPVICVVLAAVSAGLYLAWLSFGGAYQNPELRALPSQLASVNDEIARFEAGASPFQLIVDKPPASDSNENEQR